MDYLSNSFNLEVVRLPKDNISDLVHFLFIGAFYGLLIELVSSLSVMNTIYNNKAKCESINEIIEIPGNIFSDLSKVSNKETLNLQRNLLSLLDKHSLDRQYILYYIFKMQGSTDRIHNTYNAFKNINATWNTIFKDENRMDKIDVIKNPCARFNLDNTIEDNIEIVIENDIISCNEAHIRFLSWLYNSGIYEYLTTNNALKKCVLDQMNNLGLLNGNVFLKYQMFLVEMENKEQIEREFNKESSEQNTMQDSCNTDSEDADYEEDNDKELLNRSTLDDLSDWSEMSFAKRLLLSVGTITIRSSVAIYYAIKNTVREELAELFHTPLE